MEEPVGLKRIILFSLVIVIGLEGVLRRWQEA